MSKKIAKRSLALGALMAFVITGSAMAAELATNESLTGTMNGNNESYTLAADVVTLSSTVENTLIKDATIAVDAGKTLNLISKASGGDWNGVINNGVTITGDGIINIKQEAGSGNAIGSRPQQQDVVNITANTVYADVVGNGAAIYAENEDKVTITAKEITLIGKKGDLNGGGNAAAIYATGEVEIKGFDNLTLSVTNGTTDKTEGGPAVIANGTDAKVTITGTNVTASSEGRSAIVAQNGTLTMNVASLDATAKNLEGGTSIRKNSVIGAEDANANLKITVANSMTVNGDSSITTAIGAKGGASVTVDGTADLVINGAVQAEALSTGGSNINLKGDDITITATATTPSETEGAVRNVNIEATGKVTIDADGLCGVGGGADKETMAQTINSIKAKEIEITSETAFGVYANNHSYHEVGTRVQSSLEAETITITSQKDGIYASNGAVTEIKGFKTLSVTSQEQGIGSEYGDITIEGGSVTVTSAEEGIRSKLGGDIEIEAEYVKVDAGLESIKTTGDSNVLVDADTVQLIGDITAEDTSTVESNFNGTDSFLTGKVTTDTTANTALTFNDGATWNVTGTSTVSTLAGNDAKISVVDAEEAEGWVTVGENNANKLTVVTASETTDTEETLQALSKVVVTTDEEGKQIAAADEVQLTNAVYDNITAEVNGLGEVSVKDKVVAVANYSVSDMAAIGLMSWRAEMNDMNKRMGELRNANGEHGVWVRMVRGEDEYNSVKHQYNQYQLGYDEKLSTDPSWTVGVALSYTDGESSFAQGNGENTNKALSIYGSKLNEDGSFIDLIAKYARLENDFDTFGGMGGTDYSTNGYSVSAEFGKRIQQGNGVWVEPQVELSYGKVSAVDYLTKKGLKVDQDGMESIVGRVGFSLGKDIKDGNVYARASYLYDFDGETSVSLGGQEKLEQDLGGGWWEVGVGANINLSKATYIYADVEKTFGGEVDTNWQWNLGVRYSF